jgi:beta-glucosidase
LLVDGKTVMDQAERNGPMVAQRLIDLSAGAHKVVLEDFGVEPFVNGILRVGIVREDAVVHPAALELAKQADAVVLSVGFDIESEGEGADREFQLLPGQNELIQAVAAVNPHTIVVLNAGGSVDAASWIDRVPALLDIWYLGEEGGTALGQILFGDADPSGRLPISWERQLKDNPSAAFYYTTPGTNRIVYGDDIFVGYRGYEHNHVAPLFPFGFGLSYTNFKYSNLEVHPVADATGLANGLHYEASFDVTNTGTRAGSDVAQLYLAEDHPQVPRPPQELKGFARVELNAGETKHITIPVDTRSFAWYDVAAKAWHVDAGSYTMRVGRSSEDIRLTDKLVIQQQVMLPVSPATPQSY